MTYVNMVDGDLTIKKKTLFSSDHIISHAVMMHQRNTSYTSHKSKWWTQRKDQRCLEAKKQNWGDDFFSYSHSIRKIFQGDASHIVFESS